MTLKSFEIMEKTESAWGPIIWPARMTIVVGAFLLLLQGLAKLIRDIITAIGVGQS